MKAFLLYLTLGLTALLPLAAEEPPIWDGERITPKQPFRATIIGAKTTWISVEVLLKSTEKPHRYLQAHIHGNEEVPVSYIPLDEKQAREIVDEAVKEGSRTGWHIIRPGLSVHEFNWGHLYTVGRAYGNKCIVHQKFIKRPAPKIPSEDRVKIRDAMLTINGHYKQPDGRVFDHKFPVEIKLLADGTFTGTYQSWVELHFENRASRLDYIPNKFKGTWTTEALTLRLKAERTVTPLPEFSFPRLNGLAILLDAP